MFVVFIIVKGTDCRSTHSSMTLTASLLGVFSRGTLVSASMVPMQQGNENGSEARSPDRIIICSLLDGMTDSATHKLFILAGEPRQH